MLKKIICWLLVVFWLLVIYLFSSHDGSISNHESKTFTHIALEEIAKFAQKIGIIEEIPTGKEAEGLVKDFNPFMRKLAHFSIYFILGILIMVALTPYRMPPLVQFMLTIILCFFYSLTDEYHQTLVSGRNGTIIDCIIDTIGSTSAALLWMVLVKNKKKS